jgi:hypothetical protein
MNDISIGTITTKLPELHIIASSLVQHKESIYFLTRTHTGQTQLGIYAAPGSPSLTTFQGTTQEINGYTCATRSPGSYQPLWDCAQALASGIAWASQHLDTYAPYAPPALTWLPFPHSNPSAK